jgi:hypothetical protein
MKESHMNKPYTLASMNIHMSIWLEEKTGKLIKLFNTIKNSLFKKRQGFLTEMVKLKYKYFMEYL